MISATITSLVLSLSPAVPSLQPLVWLPVDPGLWGQESESEESIDPVEAILLVPDRVAEGKSCSQCTHAERVVLCATHAQAEDATFERISAEWRGLDEQQKVDALVEIGNLTRSHTNAPSSRVATFLVECLNSERKGYVRAAAAVGLGWGQNPTIALPPLMEILKDKQKKNPTLRAKLQELTDEVYEKSAVVMMVTDRYGVQALAALKKELKYLLPLLKRLAKDSEHYIWEEHILAASARSLGSFSSPRCTKALLKAASTWDSKMALDGIACGLLANGTRPCVRAAIRSLDALEKEVNSINKQIKKVRDGKAGQAPRGFEGGNVAWRRWYEDARFSSLETLEEGRTRQQGLIGKRLTMLREFAESKDLEPPASSKRGPYIRWNIWFSKNQEAFPKK